MTSVLLGLSEWLLDFGLRTRHRLTEAERMELVWTRHLIARCLSVSTDFD
jgi:hypothetical protein